MQQKRRNNVCEEQAFARDKLALQKLVPYEAFRSAQKGKTSTLLNSGPKSSIVHRNVFVVSLRAC